MIEGTDAPPGSVAAAAADAMVAISFAFGGFAEFAILCFVLVVVRGSAFARLQKASFRPVSFVHDFLFPLRLGVCYFLRSLVPLPLRLPGASSFHLVVPCPSAFATIGDVIRLLRHRAPRRPLRAPATGHRTLDAATQAACLPACTLPATATATATATAAGALDATSQAVCLSRYRPARHDHSACLPACYTLPPVAAAGGTSTRDETVAASIGRRRM